VARFGDVYGFSFLDDVVLAAAACGYVHRVAWFGGVFCLLSILDDVVLAAAAYEYGRLTSTVAAWRGSAASSAPFSTPLPTTLPADSSTSSSSTPVPTRSSTL
jgi:hypothetical protein